MKKLFLLMMAAVFLAAGAAAPTASYAEATYKLKFGHTGAPNHHYQTIATMFAKRVNELSGGDIEITVYPSDQLGKQLEITEGVMAGSVDDFRKVMDGPIGEKFSKMVEPHGAIVIGWWENGMRHLTNNKLEVKTPADMKGLKIRVPEGEVFVDTFKALGSIPTVIAFGELYSALQLKTVDGQENPAAHIVTQKFYEVQKYVTRTGHIHMSSPILMNKVLFDSMPEKDQKAILQAGREMGPIHTKMVADLEKQQWDEIGGKYGMKITDVDKAPFREAVNPVIDKYKKKLNAKLIEEVQACVAGK